MTWNRLRFKEWKRDRYNSIKCGIHLIRLDFTISYSIEASSFAKCHIWTWHSPSISSHGIYSLLFSFIVIFCLCCSFLFSFSFFCFRCSLFKTNKSNVFLFSTTYFVCLFTHSIFLILLFSLHFHCSILVLVGSFHKQKKKKEENSVLFCLLL